MKKLILLSFILICLFFTGCLMETITYCPYCSYATLEEIQENLYKCSSCEKVFGAKEWPIAE